MSEPHHTHEHSACFQIPCTLRNHSFISTVLAIPNATAKPGVEDLPSTSQNPSQQGDVPRGSPSQDKPALACSNISSEGGPPKEEGHPSDDDDFSSFGCWIVE